MGRPGFEPETSRLKAECSTAELATHGSVSLTPMLIVTYLGSEGKAIGKISTRLQQGGYESALAAACQPDPLWPRAAPSISILARGKGQGADPGTGRRGDRRLTEHEHIGRPLILNNRAVPFRPPTNDQFFQFDPDKHQAAEAEADQEFRQI